MSEIFYSQIDENLKAELNARAKAGKQDRSNAALDFMLGKIANVELVAYKNQEHKFNDSGSYLYKLGGREVIGKDYLPAGYLDPKRSLTTTDMRGSTISSGSRNNNTYKTPPFITSCNVSLNDHTMGTLNSATINITIPNPDYDLDFMESTFARPGRAVTLKIEYPESAVITKGKLGTKTTKPDIPSVTVDNNKLNTVIINALVISFELSYQTDATIAMTLHLRGTSNVYTDVSMLTDPDSATKNTETLPNDFYAKIYDDIKITLDEVREGNQSVEPHEAWDIPNNIDLPSTLSAIIKESVTSCFRSSNGWDKKERYYANLGLLVYYINSYILSKQKKFVPNAYIICDTTNCFSNYYEHLVSADPNNILIIPNHVYGKNVDGKDNYFLDKGKNFTGYDVFSDSFSNSTNFSYPSKIYVNLDYVNAILKELEANIKTYRVNDFLSRISAKINTATGGAINMQLISYPHDPDYLLFYDANFLGDKRIVIPYSVPMMANSLIGSIVSDFKFNAKLPSSMQGLMYTVNNSDTISEEQIAPYMNFMYNNSAVTRVGNIDTITGALNTKEAKELEEKYKASHEKYLAALKVAKQEFGDNKGNPAKQVQLQAALTKYIQYPSPSISKSNQMQSPVYPYEVEFTINGINGFRYGDVLEFNMLPSKYRTSTTFSIISITHNVTTAGEWSTNIKCIMRPKFD